MSGPCKAKPAEERRDRFIIGGHGVPDALATIENDPAIELLGVSGPRKAPFRLTVTMSERSVDTLRERFGDQLIIEPDLPLTPF